MIRLVQPQESVTVADTLLIASIPAAIALLGVVVTVVVSQRVASRAAKIEREERNSDRNHQADVERDKFLRAERIVAYRTLIQAASDALWEGTLATLARASEQQREVGTASAVWASALAGVQLVGARPVVEAAESIESIRLSRLRQQHLVGFIANREPNNDPDSPDFGVGGISDRTFGTMMSELLAEDDELLAAVVEACRSDIAVLKE